MQIEKLSEVKDAMINCIRDSEPADITPWQHQRPCVYKLDKGIDKETSDPQKY